MAALPRTRRIVLHQPETARYQRAREKFDYLLTAAVVLGVRQQSPEVASEEIAIWAPSANGQSSGNYACVRLYYESLELTLAVLFCFYDGTERSPGFRSEGAALVYSRSHGFKELGHERA